MLEASILDLIYQRRNGYRQRSKIQNDVHEAERSISIAEEYDTLIAEIETLGHSRHAKTFKPRIEEDPSEQWILGDQGQLGG